MLGLRWEVESRRTLFLVCEIRCLDFSSVEVFGGAWIEQCERWKRMILHAGNQDTYLDLFLPSYPS